MNTMQNARFWFYWNQTWVKLTIKPNTTITLSTGRVATEEGWSAEHEMFHFSEGVVWRESVDEGRDCDGFISNYNASCCHIGNLRSHSVDCNDTHEHYLVPSWESTDSAVYDEFAQAAGY